MLFDDLFNKVLGVTERVRAFDTKRMGDAIRSAAVQNDEMVTAIQKDSLNIRTMSR